MDKMFCCTACGVEAKAKCDCGKAYKYMTAGDLAELGIKLYPDLSNRTIAEKMGVGPATVDRARESVASNEATEKRTGKDGGKYKATKKAGSGKGAKVRDAVEAAVEAGKSVSRKKLAEEHGVGEHVVQLEAVRARAYQEGYNKAYEEMDVDPTTLSKSAQEKISAAGRQHQKKLDATFEQRVQTEIKRRVMEKVLPSFEEERKDHALYMRSRKGVFKQVEYNVILRCVHPDLTPSIEEKNRAFQLLHERRTVLLADKDDPKNYPSLPTLDEFMRGK